MAPRTLRGHHARDEPPSAVSWSARHPCVRHRARARPDAAWAHARVALGRARPPFAGERARAARGLVPGSLRDAAAAGKEPGPLLRLPLARPRLPRRRRVRGPAPLL